MELDPSIVLLGVLVFIAGMVDSIAGGGGLITVPAYLNYKLPESMVLGTNKLSSSLGTLVAVVKYLTEIKFSKRYLVLVGLSSMISSSIGALLISSIPPAIIRMMIFILLPPISLYLALSKEFGIKDHTTDIPEWIKNTKTLLISSLVSFYDGIMGPATGTFLAVGYSRYVGYDVLKSTALAKFTNLISNISALTTFMLLDKVNFNLGFSMGIISAMGNFIGAKVTLKRGICVVKPLLILISNIIIFKIIVETIKNL